MRSCRNESLNLLLLLLAILVLAMLTAAAAVVNAAPAQQADDPFEYDETARVLRVSLLRGEVSLRRAGNSAWERVRLNSPLVEGDALATGRDARLEIQIDSHNFLRVGADSVLHIVTLRAEGIALSLAEGTASVRLARFDRDREYFEVDAPKTTVAAEKRGLYRLDVARDGGVEITMRDGGQARIYSETSGFTLRDKRRARLIAVGDEAGDWELSAAPSFDEWDGWIDDRERYLAARPRYADRDRYYDRDIWGAEELDAYGDWTYAKDYGWVWRPHITVINRYYNWAPYRYGHWTWCPPYGWTWVGDEDWGWAPYHYGRWVYYNNNWCWAPRGYGHAVRRNWWRPALVAFVYIPTSHGEQVAWYPLQYGQHDPRSRLFGHRPNLLTPLGGHEVARLERTNPAYLRAVTTLPVREFGATNVRARAAATDIARRAFTSEPVRGRLPITPAVTERTTALDEPGRAGSNVTRPALISPARPLPVRPTGAATRAPGVSLDGELRRARVFGGRAPLASPAGETEGSSDANDRRTGVVARPRPARPLTTRSPAHSRAGEDGGDGLIANPRPPLSERPRRPDLRGGEAGGERSTNRSEPEASAPPAETDSRRPAGGRNRNSSRAGDDSTSSPSPFERRPPAARPSRPAPTQDPHVSPPSGESIQARERTPPTAAPRVERPERAEPRVERPTPRYEQREERREQSPRQEQPRQEQQPPPARSEPPTRSQPAPPSSSAPPRDRSPAPARPPRMRDEP